MNALIRHIAWIILFIFSCRSHEKFHDNISTSQIEKIVKEYVDSHLFTGVILIAKEGKVIYQNANGYENIEKDILNSIHTKFIIGSLSKSFTSTLIMKLVQNGDLKLEDTIGKYLTELPDSIGNIITIHHLVSNTSGLRNYFEIPGFTEGEFNYDIQTTDFVSAIMNMPLAFSPGEHYLYSNSGYFLLGLIIEKVTSLSYEEALQKYILKPIKMNETGVYVNSLDIPNMSQGYRLTEEGGYRKQNHVNYSLFTAAGNLYSTAKDILKFDQALYGDNLLDIERKELLFDANNNYGWSVDEILLVVDSVTIPVIWYNGQIKGHSSIFGRFKVGSYSIIILSNNGMGFAFKSQLLEDLTAVLYQAPIQRKRNLSFDLNMAIYQNKLSEFIPTIRLKNVDYEVNEALMEDLAQQLYLAELEEASIKVRELNLEFHPNSFDCLINLAEVYNEFGFLKESLDLYQRALEIQPDNKTVHSNVIFIEAQLK